MNKRLSVLFLLLIVVVSGCVVEKPEENTTTKIVIKVPKNIVNEFENKIETNYEKLNEIINQIQNLEFENYNFTDLYVNIAIILSSKIKDFPQIDETTFKYYEKFEKFVTDVNTIIDLSNENFGTWFKKIEISDVEFKKFSKNVDNLQKYSPLIEPYNRLIESAKNINRNDLRTINRFYINLFLFGTDVVLTHNKVFYNIELKYAYYLNNELNLVKIKSICGNVCYEFVLNQSYYFINIYITQVKDNVEIWLNQNT